MQTHKTINFLINKPMRSHIVPYATDVHETADKIL